MKTIAMGSLDQNDRILTSVTEIILPDPIRQIVPGISLISVSYNSVPPLWGRVALDQNGKAYVIKKLGLTPQQQQENLKDLLLVANLEASSPEAIAQTTVITAFLTHSPPDLISWTSLEKIKSSDDLTQIINSVLIENLEDHTYQSILMLTGSQKATTQLIYKFSSTGQLINIQEKYMGLYFQ